MLKEWETFLVWVCGRFRLDDFMLSFCSNYVCKTTKSSIALIGLLPRYTKKFYQRVVKTCLISFLAASSILAHCCNPQKGFSALGVH